MTWGAMPAVYYVTLECPDGRWWRGTILATGAEAAVAAGRAASGMADAPLLLCDRMQGAIAPLVLHTWLEEPCGWTSPAGQEEPMIFNREAWHKDWRARELAAVDRELGRVVASFALVATFLKDHDAGGELLAEAVALGERSKALQRRCKATGEE